jgi:hypothetical protein
MLPGLITKSHCTSRIESPSGLLLIGNLFELRRLRWTLVCLRVTAGHGLHILLEQRGTTSERIRLMDDIGWQLQVRAGTIFAQFSGISRQADDFGYALPQLGGELLNLRYN